MDDTPPEVGVGALMDRLVAVEEQLRAFHARAQHREEIIDRLHAENQELRSGERRAVLEPVMTDLVRLHDALEREADGLAERGVAQVPELLRSLADDVVLALERIGVEPFTAAVGDPFDPERHRAVSVVPAADPELTATLAQIEALGFQDGVAGRVRRKVPVRVYRHDGPPASTDADRSAATTGDTTGTHGREGDT